MDVAFHVGTLGAVLIYFWRDVLSMIAGFFDLLKGRVTPGGKLFLLLCVGTIPAVIFGLILSRYGLSDQWRSVNIIGWTTVIYAIVLYVVDQFSSVEQEFQSISGAKAFWIGCAQALALIPGTSRSGACMTMMRFLGFNRLDAARFSFLLAIPSITAAASLTIYQMVKEGQLASLYKTASLGAMVAFIAGLIAINFMLNWLRRADFTPFILYRLVLGGFLLFWGYFL
jgi:undecaprenyl-diphosphatase